MNGEEETGEHAHITSPNERKQEHAQEGVGTDIKQRSHDHHSGQQIGDWREWRVGMDGHNGHVTTLNGSR